MTSEEVGALVLTGGASRRMGTAKAALPLGDGTTMSARIAGLLAAVATGPVLEVGPGYTGLPTVADAGDGPLAALAAGGDALLARGHPGAALAVACDLPNITAALLAFLVRTHGTAVPIVDGRAQSLCARYDGRALRQASVLAAAGERSLRALLVTVPVTALGPDVWGTVADASAFADVDTPEDLDRLRLGAR